MRPNLHVVGPMLVQHVLHSSYMKSHGAKKISLTMFRAVSRAAVRRLHQVPALKNHEAFAKNGVDGLFSPLGYRTAWTDYQRYLTTKLTLLTNGTENETRSAYQILLLTSNRTTEQHTFHYASQAHNNHLFFEQLTDSNSAKSTRPSRFLMERLADEGIVSVEQLKERVLRLVEPVVGQGWVFLVEKPDKSVQLLLCHNDGTPYYHGKNQSLDLNGSVDEASFSKMGELQKQAGELDFTLPIMALNFWDVAYYADYGINGRADYLSRVWDCINWDVVNKRMFQI